MTTAAMKEIGDFRQGRGWFGRPDSIELGKSADKGAQLLWEAAVLFDAAPITGPLNLKLATCVSGIGKCERHHKSTQQHRTKQGNRKLGSTTAAFCEIKMACSTRRQEIADRKMDEEKRTRPSILLLFKEHMRNFARHRNGLKEARDAILASRAAIAALREEESDSGISMMTKTKIGNSRIEVKN